MTQALNTRKVLAFLCALLLIFAVMAPNLALADNTTTSGLTNEITVNEDGSVSLGNAGNQSVDVGSVVTKYKSIATAITGILTITMLIFMLIQFTKLGAAGDNEAARKKAIGGILTTGIATALLGGATFVIAFFWNALNGI